MVDRSVRVVLSSDAQKFISSMASSADSVKKLGAAAVGIRPHFEGITSAAEKLHAKLTGLGSNAGLADMTRDVAKLGAALRGLSGGTELTRLATGLRGLSTAGPGLTVTVEQIRKLASAFSRLSVSSGDAAGLREFSAVLHGLSALSAGSAANEVRKLSAGIRLLVRDASSVPALRALATALRDLGAAGGALGGLGNVGNSLHGMQAQIDQLQRSVAALRGAAGGGSGGGGESGGIFGQIFGGAALGNLASNLAYAGLAKVTSGIRSTITATADYETEINTFGAVTKASNTQMKEASALAIQLGGDVTIAGASASDAAHVLVELAKGGLSVSSSFAAAKGTLQLAAAATVDVGVAAGIQTAALNSFKLGADQAGKVADILSNTAAAASGEITDFAEGMKYSAVSSHQLGLSLTENQAALGLLAQSGMKGSMAGTNFNDVLMRLNPTTKKMRDAMHELGVTGFDANGQFEGMVPLINQLSAAHKRLSPAAFESANKMAFGAQGMRAAGILAEDGSKAYTTMYNTIDHGSGVVAFSTAKMSGLGGAFKNVQNQIETAQVTLGEKFSPALQRALAGISNAIPVFAGFLAGPAIGDGFSKLGTFFKPLIDGAEALGKTAMPYVKNFLSSVGDGFHSIITFIHPVVTAIGDFWMHASDNGSVAKVGNVLAEVGTAFKDVMAFIAPVGAAIGGAIKWIGGLGEFGTVVGTVVTAMLGFRLVKPLLTGLFNVVPGFTAATAAVKGFGATYKALGSTGMGSVSAALGAATQGAANLGKGLLAAFGGGVGIAIMGITTLIALWPTIADKLSGSETSAATATQNHTDAVKGLSDALEASNGKVDETVRKNALTLLQNASWGKSSKDVTAYADRLSNLGVTYSTLVDGMLNVPGAAVKINNAYDTQVKSLQHVITAGTTYTKSRNGLITSYSDEAKTAQGNLDILRQLHDGYAGQAGSLTASTKKYQENAAAIKGAAAATSAAAAANAAAWQKLPPYLRDAQDIDKASAAARGAATAQAALAAHYVSTTGAAASSEAAYKAFASTVAGINIAPDSKGVDQYTTDTQDAFDHLKQTMQDATTLASLFWFAMVDPNKVTTKQTIYADATAIDAVGAAFRDRATKKAAVVAAQAALDTARTGHVGTQAEATAAQDKSTIAADNLAKAQAALAKLQGGGATLSQAQITAAQDKSTIAAGNLASAEAALQKMQGSGKATAAGLAAAQARVDLAQQRATAAADKAAAAQSGVGSASTASASQIAAAQAKVDLAQQAATKSADAASAAQQNVGQQVKGAGKNAAEVAAKTRDLAAANDAAAQSASNIYDAQLKSGETASKRIAQIYVETAATKGSAAGIKAVTKYLTDERKAFIDKEVASGQSVVQAGKDADSIGLIASNATALIRSNGDIRIQVAKDVAAAAKKATGDYNLNFVAHTKDALGDIAHYGLDIAKIPKSITSKFNADLAVAKAAGRNLFEVYNKTTGNWVAKFLTPNEAAARKIAGDVLYKYDQVKGTWTAHLTAIDAASDAVKTVAGALDSIKDKTVHLTVDAAGNAGATTIKADGSFVTKGGGHGFATGGFVSGPGGPTSDSIPARLSDGEFVVKASATATHLPLLEHINNAPGYANGGLVGGQKTTVKMSETGSITAALDAVKHIYSNADKSAAAMNAAAAAMMSIGPSGLLGSQNPAAWGWGVGKNIVPFSFHGIDFPAGVASGTEPIWSSFLAQLEPMILGGFRPGEDWGFENRDNVNSPGSKSFHSYGLALDVNAPENGNGSTPGNGPGQVPPAAGALARRFNMLWGGDFTGTKDPMHFELHQRPGGSVGGSSSLAGGVGAGAVQGGAGVERWHSLVDHVFNVKGFPVSQDYVMLNQMSHESSGNPAAQNNTDINAINGHPSVGLLQFIPDTFAKYADPGFNSNIWDPESQMRAFLNYVPATYGSLAQFAQRNYGAYADGGFVSGPGGPRSDSINARLSNGEFVVNSAATSQHLDLLHAINGYANGGVVGSALALSGRTAATVGPELANVVQALTDIAQAVTDARTAATDKRALENTAWDNLNVIRQTGRDHRGNAAFNLGAAQEIMNADLAKVPAQNRAIYQARAAATAKAQDRLTAALAMQETETRKTTARTRVTDQARVFAATRALAVAQTRQQSSPAGAAAGKLAADEARIESISRVNAKMAATDRLALAKADRDWKLAQRTRISYDAAASAAERFQTSQQHAYRVQQSYAAQVDQLSGSLATASQNLSSLQSSRSSMMSGISGTVAGFDSGILGHPDTRNSFATILKGQQYDIAKAQAFNVSIVKLRKLGLSKETLNTIAAAGVDGGGVTAAALAKASPAQIKQLNATQASLHRIGDNVGATVAGDFYDIGIRAGQGMVKGLESQIKNIEKSMIRYANAATGALSKKLRIHSPSRATHELGVHAATGFTNGVLSGYGAAHSAMAGMVQLPQPFIPAQGYGRASAPAINLGGIKVFVGDREITDIVSVEVGGFATELGHSLEKAGMQA